MTYLLLFAEFFKIGLFAIGGGPATLPFLNELAQKPYGWFTERDLANFVAVSEGTPGPVGINMATYAGYHAGGVLGGIIATLGIITPSVVIILVIAKFLRNFRGSKVVNAAFYGIRPAVAGLITSSVIRLFGMSLYTAAKSAVTLHWPQIFLAAAILALTGIKKLKNLHPVIWLAVAAAVGIIFKFK